MAPGDVAHVPRTPSPVAKAGPVAGHFRSRARLRRLLVRLRRPTPQRSLRSLRRRSFALYVRLRHYRSSLLAAASNSLTFVRGADRAYCAPRKWQFGLICAPRKRPLGLLYCINGFADQPMLACASRRATPKGVERAPGSGTLPPFAALTALIVRRVNGHGDQPMLTCASRRTPPEGALACAPGSGILPPALCEFTAFPPQQFNRIFTLPSTYFRPA